jgi:hypothetical protein
MPDHIITWLNSHLDEYATSRALAIGAVDTFDIALDEALLDAAWDVWRASYGEL